MERPLQDTLEVKTLENVTKWQAIDNPLAPLMDKQAQLLYEIEDVVEELYYKNHIPQKVQEDANFQIATQEDYVKWMSAIETRLKADNIANHIVHYDSLRKQTSDCELLYEDSEDIINALNELRTQYHQVTVKTDSLHNLSEQLIKHQKNLKDKKLEIHDKLQYFTLYQKLQGCVIAYSSNVNGQDFTDMLDGIDKCIAYYNANSHYLEAPSYKVKCENLLQQCLQTVLKYFTHIITEATAQVRYLDNKANLVIETATKETNINTAFSFYYGKFQNASTKVNRIMAHIEGKIEQDNIYERVVHDCQRAYFAERSPLIMAAVAKALGDLKDNHKNDHSILFRSSGHFIIKVCQDEVACFHLFMSSPSTFLSDYLSSLCQNLYDVLRPSLIGINHLEVLTELCTIIKEMLTDQIQNNVYLDPFVETIKQLLHDIEERLVFRANVFFQHDLSAYVPSPGDLAYPEKLEQMENIAEEITERRPDSRSSSVSLESQEVSNITNTYMGQFRSYTGNSPADLHGMWYPTVKRSLVCLSRLYYCLDREIFQGLAQEALLICVRTIENAAKQISSSKGKLHGKLFQIKHLLIIREQIAPFQVDFTVKEMSLDFSNCKTAAVHLLQKRDKLFSLSSNNALLEFLLEGTPKVKEYLIDSRKEIDKQLKLSCETFITHATGLLVENLSNWLQKAEHLLKVTEGAASLGSLREQEFGKAQNLSALVTIAQRNIKTKIPEIQKYMKLYFANRETEFILFRPIKNNIINTFIQLEQVLITAKYTPEEILMIACPTPEQLNILISSVSLVAEQEHVRTQLRYSQTN